MRRRELFVALTIACAGLVLGYPQAEAAAAVFGYIARADVAVPGGKIQTWVMTGVLNASDPGSALAAARSEAAARMAGKGAVQVGPTVDLCSPFVGRTEKVEKER